MACDGRVSVVDAIASALPLKWAGMLSVASRREQERAAKREDGVAGVDARIRF